MDDLSPIPISRPFLGEEEAAAAREAILSGWVTQGPRVKAFEEAFATTVGAPHAIAVSSCTTALHLVMHALGIGSGDEVIVPSMSFIATANSVRHAGATPVFAEVEPEFFTLDPKDAERRITPRTKAIMPVHQIGNPADLDAFLRLAAEHKLLLLEDAACAIGTTYRGRRIGSHGPPACFSLHARKILTTGDGGMITCHDAALAARLRTLRQHGMTVSDLDRHGSKSVIVEGFPELGYNYRLTDIQAAVGIEQLKRLPWLLSRRRELAKRYSEAIAGSEILSRWVLPHLSPPWGESTFQSYAVRLKSPPVSRHAIIEGLLARGIHSRRGIMTAHREGAYRRADGSFESLPVSEAASDGSLLLPLFPQMADTDVDRVARATEEVSGS